MQAKPTHRSSSRFLVLELAIQAIEILRPVVETIHRRDRDLGDQLRRALSSVALNTAEGNRSQGGHRVARFSTAAWGYMEPAAIEAGERVLDRVAGMLHSLGAKQ